MEELEQFTQELLATPASLEEVRKDLQHDANIRLPENMIKEPGVAFPILVQIRTIADIIHRVFPRYGQTTLQKVIDQCKNDKEIRYILGIHDEEGNDVMNKIKDSMCWAIANKFYDALTKEQQQNLKRILKTNSKKEIVEKLNTHIFLKVLT